MFHAFPVLEAFFYLPHRGKDLGWENIQQIAESDKCGEHKTTAVPLALAQGQLTPVLPDQSGTSVIDSLKGRVS